MSIIILLSQIELIWQKLTSPMAMIGYTVSLLLLVGLIVFLMIINETKRQKLSLEKEVPQLESTPPVDASMNQESRFFMLSSIDQKASVYLDYEYENDISLKDLCLEFQAFSAHELNLYYDIEDIRRFIGGIAVSQIMILQGMSGTGKTSLAYAFGEYLSNSAVVVPIQPMWKERTDLIGYYNEFTKKFNETTLFQKMYEANYNDQIYITVLDEMNIARVEYYFAEFLSLLELPDHNKRYLDVISDVWTNDPKRLSGGKLILPKNMWFVGTANNDDSTFAISDKVYDRAMVINLDKKAVVFEGKQTNTRKLSASALIHLIKTAQKTYQLSQRNLRRIKTLDKYLIHNFQITFGNRIMQQIKNYVPVIVSSGGTELQAIDDILSKKVLRKLETKNRVYVKSAIPGLVAFIDELFGEHEMLLCKEYIKKIEINA
ncbi:MAG: AAA family ATPase [Acholeplasmataceae bacterium]